jgi:hypothetical protein
MRLTSVNPLLAQLLRTLAVYSRCVWLVEMKFAFIDGTKKDKSTRRLARSHAMRGKNVGKTHPRRPRPAMGEPYTSKEATPANLRNLEEENGTAPVQGAISFYHAVWGGDALLSASFPLVATPQSLDVINQCKC